MTAADFMAVPEQNLCMDYLTYPSINIHQSARAEAIAARKLNCSQYLGAAQLRLQANQNFDAAMQSLRNQSAPASSPTGVSCVYQNQVTSGISKICYYNCAGSTKAMNVSAAQICPLSATL